MKYKMLQTWDYDLRASFWSIFLFQGQWKERFNRQQRARFNWFGWACSQTVLVWQKFWENCVVATKPEGEGGTIFSAQNSTYLSLSPPLETSRYTRGRIKRTNCENSNSCLVRPREFSWTKRILFLSPPIQGGKLLIRYWNIRSSISSWIKTVLDSWNW